MKEKNIEQEIKNLDYGKMKARRTINDLDREIEFTKAHMKHKKLAPYLLEAECMRVQAPLIMMPLTEENYFAGHLDRMFVGIDPERGDLTETAFFCSFELLEEQLKMPDVSDSIKEDIQFLVEYWKNEATYFKCRNAFPEHMQRDMPSDDYYSGLQISFPMFGFGGPALDFEKLVKIGIPGLTDLVSKRKSRAQADGEKDLSFYDAMLAALDIFIDTANNYAKQALQIAENSSDEDVKERHFAIADSLKHITNNKPETFHQGMQLIWLYSLSALVKNYGRMDIALGDLLANDLMNKRLTEEKALEITVGLWRKIVDRGDYFNNRITVGGKARANEDNADKFAMIALEAQKIVNHAIPQLSLRWYDGMNKEIWDKTFEVLATGSTMPIIYNDDANIPGMMKALDVSYEEAENYAFYGCGEFLLDHSSVASPDAALNALKALDATLRNGIDSFTGEKQGMDLGNLSTYKTFDELKYAVIRQLEYQISMLADAQATIYRVTGQNASFPFLSMLYDDCIERGKPLLAGGVKYSGGTIESFGNNTTADSLYAIKKLVYDQKLITPERMMECLDKDFKGCDKEYKMIRNIAKFGNDDTEADEMSVWFNQMMCEITKRQRDYTSLDSFLVVLVNNGDSVLHGRTTGASADGRKYGQPLSNGNQPSSGNDVNGATALLNSMSKLKAEYHAGVTNNVKFSKSTLQKNPEPVKALIKAYFSNGGTQIMITSTDKGELEKAQKHPDDYKHIFVRVGGYSERYVDLPRDIQMEVLNRTLY